ncbi:MAG: glycosyltransferase family 2 protein [Candidatus Aminicenantaceae bacterium]
MICDNIVAVDISVVIITYNEEKRLEPALKSVEGLASEIIIVDSFSNDNTVRIAKKYTKKVYQRKWTNFADQKNFANGFVSFPWILSLDADERVSPELQDEILKIKKEEPDCAGFLMPRQVFYLGKWIRHSGWYPDRKIRLFLKDKARWEGEYVHERLIIEGKIQKLENSIHHFTYRNISEHLSRINKFSDLGAQKLYTQKSKCRWYHLVFMPFFRFAKSFIFRAGFLDGYAGFIISVLHGYAIFARYAKLREIWKKGERIEPFPY